MSTAAEEIGSAAANGEGGRAWGTAEKGKMSLLMAKKMGLSWLAAGEKDGRPREGKPLACGGRGLVLMEELGLLGLDEEGPAGRGKMVAELLGEGEDRGREDEHKRGEEDETKIQPWGETAGRGRR